ncbi:MAG: hypothetical protein M3273_03670 [Actinomycetota bacterium]|nr:hypothetical protein [Actinomycetota bacterium]
MRKGVAVTTSLLLAAILTAAAPVSARCAASSTEASWRTIPTPLDADAFAVDAAGSIFVAGGSRIMASEDDGCSWTGALSLPSSPSAEFPFAGERFTAMAAEGSNVFAGLRGPHVLVSRDGGTTWRSSDSGLLPGGVVHGIYPSSGGEVVYLLARQALTDELLPTAGLPRQGAGVSTTVLYRSADGGTTWEEMGEPGATYTGPRGSDVEGARATGAAWDLAVDPADPDHVVVVAKGIVHRSTDGGRSWIVALASPGIEPRTVSVWRPAGGRPAPAR